MAEAGSQASPKNVDSIAAQEAVASDTNDETAPSLKKPPNNKNNQNIKNNGKHVHFHASTKTEDASSEQDPFGMSIPRKIKMGKGGGGGLGPLRDAFFLFAFVGLLLYCSMSLDIAPTKDKKPRKKDKIALGVELNKAQKAMERMMLEAMEGTRRKAGCDLFTAKGGIPDTGLGVFAGRRFQKGEVIYQPSFTVPLELNDGSTTQLSPISFLVKFHPSITNVEGSVALGPDGSLDSMVLRATRPIKSGEELFMAYERHPLHLFSLHNRTLFSNIPLTADYETAAAIQGEISNAARRMEVAHMRRVQDSIKLNTGYMYMLGASITENFAPNVAKLLPDNRVELHQRKDLPLYLALLKNHSLSSLQLEGSCYLDVTLNEYEGEPAVVAARDVEKQALVQSVPFYVTGVAPSKQSHINCFSMAELQLELCPLTDIAVAPLGSATEANVALAWDKLKKLSADELSQAHAGNPALELIATKDLKKGDKLILSSAGIPKGLLGSEPVPAIENTQECTPPPEKAKTNSSSSSTVQLQLRWERHLGWSAKQGRILTANGKAPEYYTADRGFDFDETELPHYHLIQGTTSGSSGGKKDTREIFRKWKRQDKNKSDNVENNHTLSLLIGAWKRTLFYGGWEHTTEHDENVYNLQTSTLFIDLRLPTTRLVRTDRPTVQSLHDLQAADLRRYARQHVFGGYTVMQTQQTSLPIKTEMNPRKNNKYPLTCTRHHVIDWNFVGKPRNRPNKWHVEFSHNNKQEWKEWAFATDDYRQHYYCEQWQTLLLSPSSSTSSIPVLALRKHKGHSGDGILILIDNHFNFLLDHRTLQVAAFEDDTPDTTAFASLVEIVDYHVAQENLDAARAWLSLQGGHGIVSTSDGWEIDASIEFWKENTKLFTSRDEIQVVEIEGSTETSWTEKAFVRWKGEAWEIFECNLAGPKELEELLWKGLPSGPVRSKI